MNYPFDISLNICWAFFSSGHWKSIEVTFLVIGRTNDIHHMKCWQVNYWSHYLSFDMSFDTGYETLISVVIEVIWGLIFSHTTKCWPQSDLKCWQVNYWGHYFSFDMSLDIGYETSICVVIEVIWGLIFSHTTKWSEMLTGELLGSLFFIWYVSRSRYWLWNIHFCGHGGHLRSQKVKWPPMGI